MKVLTLIGFLIYLSQLSSVKCANIPLNQLSADEALVITSTEIYPTPTPASLNIDKSNLSLFQKTISKEIKKSTEKEVVTDSNLKPDIYSFKIHSDIKYRYARTYITSRVVNPNPTKSQEVTFRVVLPETAFISKFIMEIDGTPYEAYVKEKEEAKKVYTEAQSQGQSAGLVEINTRNTNVFDVNVNIKSQSKVNFNLTYEELLTRRLGYYEQSISITPDQITNNVKDFVISVNIEESQNITLLRVPNIRNDVESSTDSDGNNVDAVISRPAPNKANITWSPSAKDQSQLSKQGATGKFIVQYDIKRELEAGEVLVMNGYFVHFFSPENLTPLRKHVVFVLDTSGSMWGRRMEQLKEAMTKILDDLSSDDFFNILTFSSDVTLWSPDDKVPISPNSHWSPPPFHGEKISPPIAEIKKRQPYPATPENIKKAQKFIQSLVASGGTNIHDSILEALNLTVSIKKTKKNIEPSSEVTTTENSLISTSNSSDEVFSLPSNVESLLMFLTDGEATVGITDSTQIQTLIKTANKNMSVPIFTLGFGNGADFLFLRKLSLQNNGFARKIYEASDAALQLKGFYNEIASPLLSNVSFNYTSPESDYLVQNVTVSKFATIFGGTEITVAGKLVPKETKKEEKNDEIGTTTLNPVGDASEDYVEKDEGNFDNIVATDHKYFDVEIKGYGREGCLEFIRPEVYSSPIPWGVPVTVPFPARPTPPPTVEDLFLERLWAYLTIKQLIDKDFAADAVSNEISTSELDISYFSTTEASVNKTETESNDKVNFNKTVKTVPETPKQRALRLALKYGFVTPLTSLVVVKPNSTDVTDAKSTNEKPDKTDSLLSFKSKKNASKKPLGFSASSAISNRVHGMSNYGILPLSLNSNSGYSNSFHGHHGPPAFSYPSPQLHKFAQSAPPRLYPTSARPTVYVTKSKYTTSVDYAESLEENVEETEKNTEIVTMATTELPIKTSTFGDFENIEESNLTLSDIKWYTDSGSPNAIIVNQKSYIVSTSSTVFPEIESVKNCTVSSDGSTGKCVYLKDCISPKILDDFEAYTKNYFCSVEFGLGLSVSYAGICCIN